MAVLTAKKSGKASEAATWTPESAPTTTSELVVPTGLTVEIAANLSVVSAKTEGTGTFSGTKVLTLSGSGNSLNLGGANLALTGAGKIVLGPSGGTTTEPITNGADVKTITFSGATTSKFKLKEAITASIELVIKAGLVSLEGFEVKCGILLAEGVTTKELKLGASKVVATKEVNLTSGLNLTIIAGTSTVEMTGTGAFNNLGGYTFNAVVFTNTASQSRGNYTCASITLPASGTFLGENGDLVTVTGTIARAGSAPLVVKSDNITSNFHFIKTSGTVELENVELEHVTGEGGATFKIVNGKNLGGNTGWVFLIPLTGTLESGSTLSSKVKTQLNLKSSEANVSTLVGAVKTNLSLAGSIQNVAAFSSTLKDAIKLVAQPMQAVSTLNSTLHSKVKLSGTLTTQSQLSGVLTTKSKGGGTLTAESHLSGSLRKFISLTGSLSTSAALSGRLGVMQNVAGGTLLARSTLSGTVNTTVHVTAHLTIVSSLSAELEVIHTPKTTKLTGALHTASSLSGILIVRSRGPGKVSPVYPGRLPVGPQPGVLHSQRVPGVLG
jgi:hypothetical protein